MVAATPSSENTTSTDRACDAPSSSSRNGTTTTFVRTGYYNAEKRIREGLMFLGNYGGQGSGILRKHFGPSLAFLNSNGTGGASEPTTLADTLLLSSQEVTIVTDQSCDNSCGYTQNGTIAYSKYP
ncbi:target of Sbf [Collariella sp. IMI 366227]|nr:target of Sbf [Collariella sp. IMI 366227]